MKEEKGYAGSIRTIIAACTMSIFVAACAHAGKPGEPVGDKPARVKAELDLETGSIVLLDDSGAPLPMLSIKEAPIRETEVRAVEPVTVLRTFTNPTCFYVVSGTGMYQRKCF